MIGTFSVAYFVAAIGPTGGLQLAITSATVPATHVVPIHAWISGFSAVFRGFGLRTHIDWSYVAVFAIPSLAATLVAVLIGQQAGFAWIKLAIGFYILADVAGIFSRLQSAIGEPRAFGAASTGGLTGFVTVFIGASGPLLWTLMRNRFAERLALSATHSACLVLQHLSKILIFGLVGLSILQYWPVLIATIVASLLGTYLGQMRLQKLDERVYRYLLTAALTVAALMIIASAIQDLA